MAVNQDVYKKIIQELGSKNVRLVAVSKTKPVEAVKELYDLGQRDFGENYVQELVEKQLRLPTDIRWHFIGHLQSNKVKYIIPFIHLIHGVDSLKLLKEINKQARKNNREADCLLQVHIAREETKFGFDESELEMLLSSRMGELGELANVRICGLMGMASFTEDADKVHKEYKYLKSLFDRYAQLQSPNCDLKILSMGMSADYKIAIEQGSTMVRIGSLLFGARD
ncbi:MAG TPA: YggS family pyridoxal phosphate-dependent enzyme [Puia sp.]|jgi:pyridoxal phosphate enzyme (YggS family)|nr:YggS family pyridoxal phosphate-dependent enzyme [Puia sp.]